MDENRFSGASLGPSSGNFTQTSPSEKSTRTNPDLYKVSSLSLASSRMFHVFFFSIIFLCCVLTD